MSDLSAIKLHRQSYGIACAQARFGGPRGIWLECTKCPESQVIEKSRFRDDPNANLTDAEVAKVFRLHGWKGRGDRMMRARCPQCAA